MKMRQDLNSTTIKKKKCLAKQKKKTTIKKKKKENLIQLISLAGVQSQNCDSQTWKGETKLWRRDNTTTSTDHKG